MIAKTRGISSRPVCSKPNAVPCSSPPRNPFCGKYEDCLNRAARLNLKYMDCSRCFFRHDQSGREETAYHVSGYLRLLKVVVQGDKWLEDSRALLANMTPLNDPSIPLHSALADELDWID